MIYASVIFFALAAVFGVILLLSLLNKRKPPRAPVYLHGLLAATGLVLLIIYAMQNGNYPRASLILFLIAAAGGFTLYFRDIKGKPGPVPLALIHATAAVAAFLILLLFIL